MNYNNHYTKLINNSLRRGLDKSLLGYYTEAHHIIPRCIGGIDDKSNLVLLTPEEHLIAHKLLIKIHKNIEPEKYRNLVLSVVAMCMGSHKNRHTNKSFGWVRIKHAESLHGEGNTFYRKTHTDNTKQLISEKAKIRYKDKANHPSFGRTRSDTTKALIGKKSKGRIPVNKGIAMSNEQKTKLKEAKRKGEHWKYESELYPIWINNNKPKCNAFRTIVKKLGFPDISYQNMIKSFGEKNEKF